MSLFRGSLIHCLAGLGVAALWTLIGYSIAWLQDDRDAFIAEWKSMQAFPCLALGAWLFLISRSGALAQYVKKLTKDGSPAPKGVARPGTRVLLAFGISTLGAIIFISMGFNARGPMLYFMWSMCVFICFLAGAVTLHAIDLVITIHRLPHAKIRTHRYSPAHTPELREIVSYFTYFSLLLTIAYAFACFGTLGGHWTGNPIVIRAAQLFWPAIYVPACSVALVYPHLVIHQLIKREKEAALSTYQRDIDSLLERYETLKEQDVQRINTLSTVFDRFQSTPNYVFDFGIATKALLPHAINAIVFFAKPLLGQATILLRL